MRRQWRQFPTSEQNCVTGSCHLLETRPGLADSLNILVDCSTAYGDDPELPFTQFRVPPDKINYLSLTYAHIDHIGRVPELIAAGFRGEIICTHATKALLLPDPDRPDACDLLILELTYGDRKHPSRKLRIEALQNLLQKALADKGIVYIPAFSLGRTQELRYELHRIGLKVPVFVNSPLSGKSATNTK